MALDEHSLQSPFVYQLYKEALQSPDSRKAIVHQDIEDIRNHYLSGNRNLKATGYGAGSNLSDSKVNNLSSIARHGISDLKQSELLVRLITWAKCRSILELGTSLGINTAYLSRSETVNRIVTIEGNKDLANEAGINFSKLALTNVELINTDIDSYFENSQEKFDMVYIDANHTFDATIRYFEQSIQIMNTNGIVVLDDINWSKDMSRAWAYIQNYSQESTTIENDRLGLVFPGQLSSNRSYILRF